MIVAVAWVDGSHRTSRNGKSAWLLVFLLADNGTVYKVLGDVSTSGSPFVVEQIQVFEVRSGIVLLLTGIFCPSRWTPTVCRIHRRQSQSTAWSYTRWVHLVHCLQPQRSIWQTTPRFRVLFSRYRKNIIIYALFSLFCWLVDSPAGFSLYWQCVCTSFI